MTPTGHSLPNAEDVVPRRRKKWRTLALLLLLLVVVIAALTLSPGPWVGEPKAPNTAGVEAAKDLLKQITGGDVRAGERLSLRISQTELDGLAQLSNQALAPLRVGAKLVAAPPRSKASVKTDDASPNHLLVYISRPLPLGAWINLAATARSRSADADRGLPDITVKVGRLPVPQWLTHLVLRRLWLGLQGDVAKPLALDDAIRRTTITGSHIRLVMAHPGRDAGFAGLSKVNGTAPDANFVAAAYCAIADHTGTDLSALVRRIWALSAPENISSEDRNRALLAALAMRVVPEYRDRLAGAALPLIAKCPAPALALQLAGREDLAKHWTLSAALAATLGGQMARSMGAWKELADSAKGGSGFSFVDLAADRSGERFALAAVDPQLASVVSTRLGAITQAQMLPPELLARPEGLDQGAFERDYSAIDSPEYKQAVRAIDALLNNAGVPSL